MKDQNINDLNPPKSCFEIFNFDITPADFFESNSYLCQSVEIFNSCIFLYTPEDIMKQFHLVHLTFAGYIATKLKINIDNVIVAKGIQFLWKLLFVVSSIPNIESVIRFIKRFMNLSCYPQILFDTFKYPLNVCQLLQNS